MTKNKIHNSLGKSGLKNFARDGFISALIRGSAISLSLLVNVLMARLLGPDGFGTYAFVLSVVLFLTIPAKLGLPLFVTRETAKSIAEENIPRLWAIWRWAHIQAVLFSFISMAGLILWSVFRNTETPPTIWYWAALLIPVLTLSHLRAGAIRGLGRGLVSQVPETIVRPIIIIAALLIFFINKEAVLAAPSAVMLYTTATFIGFLIGTKLLSLYAPKRDEKKFIPEKNESKIWFLSATTVGLSMGAQTLGGSIDIVLLGIMRTNTEVGLYKVAASGSVLVGVGLQAINIILAPHLAAMYANRNVEGLNKIIKKAARMGLFLSFGPFLIFSFFGKEFIEFLFGVAFSEAHSPLFILAFGQLLGAVFGPVVLLLNMSGHEKETLKMAVVYAVINTLLNLLLIPNYGVKGAAFATAISFGVLNAILWFVAIKKLKVNTLPIP